MRLMTDGLKLAAGQALREILARSTATQLRGVASGFLMTSVVQSSSAITVATIGFVNAGLLSLAQALAVTYGSNIGTTTTGWLVAAVGFHVNVAAFALPLIGVGMALRVIQRDGRMGALGEALAGFGVFFLGIDALRGAFESASLQFEFGALAGAGPLRAFALVAVGFALTVLMQSSSAAIAIILTAAGGGVVPMGSGAALVIGANIGTTSTAGLAALGATANAKRVAAGHVAFNLLTGCVALALLPLLLVLLQTARDFLHLDSEPAAVLASFHTLFNLLGVALLWPLTPRLIRFLEHRFRRPDEDLAKPRHIDRNVLETPSLALDALILELGRAGRIVRELALSALSGAGRPSEGQRGVREALDTLLRSIGEYVQQLQRRPLSAELAALLPEVLRVSRYYVAAAELALSAAASDTHAWRLQLEPFAAAERLRSFLTRVEELIRFADVQGEDFREAGLELPLADVQRSYHELKQELLSAAGTRGEISIQHLVDALEWLSHVHRLAEQVERGARFLARLRERTRLESSGGRPEATAVEPSAASAEAAAQIS